MRKIALLGLLGMLALACSVSDVQGLIQSAPAPAAPRASATATRYVTPSQTASITATLPTPTFTSTPTFIYSGPTATASDTPQPTPIFSFVGATSDSFLTPQIGYGFASVRVDGSLILYGKCQPNSVRFLVTVARPIDETTVLIFVRLVDTTTGEYDDWGGGAIMNSDHKGSFSYTLGFENIPHFHDFSSAFVQYQIVATNSSLKVLGRTQPYLHDILLKPCL